MTYRKRVPIQGTNVVLDSEEAVNAWIAERKKRWPTAARIQEKEKKLQEAIDRGEILENITSLRGTKRRRTESTSSRGNNDRRVRGGSRGGKVLDSQNGASSVKFHPLPAKPVVPVVQAPSKEIISSSDSESDMDPVKDAVSSKPQDLVVVDAVSPIQCDTEVINPDADIKITSTTNEVSQAIVAALSAVADRFFVRGKTLY